MPKKTIKKIATPPLHALIIYGTLFLLVLSGLGYLFAPSGKEELFKTAATGLLAFFFGKLSNSFGKPLVPGGEEADEESTS